MKRIGSLQLTSSVTRLPETLILPLSQTTERQPENYKLGLQVAQLHTEDKITECVLKGPAGK